MVTIARFSKAEDAHLLRLRLEAGGVSAYLQDEHTVQTHWLYSDLIGGVRVQVAEEDLDAAREILEMPPVAEADPERPVCPRCGARRSRRRSNGVMARCSSRVARAASSRLTEKPRRNF
jgi:tRNA(Ile2) C34 agmatinyltransferase TiaS